MERSSTFPNSPGLRRIELPSRRGEDLVQRRGPILKFSPGRIMGAAYSASIIQPFRWAKVHGPATSSSRFGPLNAARHVQEIDCSRCPAMLLGVPSALAGQFPTRAAHHRVPRAPSAPGRRW